MPFWSGSHFFHSPPAHGSLKLVSLLGCDITLFFIIILWPDRPQSTSVVTFYHFVILLSYFRLWHWGTESMMTSQKFTSSANNSDTQTDRALLSSLFISHFLLNLNDCLSTDELVRLQPTHRREDRDGFLPGPRSVRTSGLTFYPFVIFLGCDITLLACGIGN